MPSEVFGEGAGAEVKVPLGSYIRALLSPEPEGPISQTLALMAFLEPASLSYVSFEGPESADPPELRLILTYGEGVTIR
jgi:hypothetical protein